MSGGIPGLLQDAFDRHDDRVAVMAEHGPGLSFRQLLEQARYVVHEMNARGIGRGDRVAIVLPNGPEMAVAFLAVASCATCAPLNPAYRSDEFAFYFDDLKPRAIIVAAGLPSPARDVAGARGIPVLELHADTGVAGRFLLSGMTGYEPRHTGDARPDDVALVLHTSGTTARPKVVPLTHANLCASASQIVESLALTSGDRCLNVMPLFHIHGLLGALLASVAAGGSVLCASGFIAPTFLDLLAGSGATWYTAVPTLHRAILDAAGHAAAPNHGSRLRFIRSCSSPLPPHLMAELEARFGVPVVEAYGMTEASHQIAVNPLPPGERRPGSVGLPSGTEVAILDDAGYRLPSCSTGEIAVRGDAVTYGYADNPDANAKAFTNGWFRTGDQGHIDGDGYIVITGRLKELINRGGEKIAPREIDEVLLLHPAVAQCVTFAAPHPTLGEEVSAAVVLRAGSEVRPRDLQDFTATRLADFKVPRRIVVLDELPKGPTGKLQRIGLAERLGVSFHQPADESTTPFESPSTEHETVLASAMADVLRLERVSTTDSFFDLGGESLLAAQFVGTVHTRVGWALTLSHVYAYPRVRDLAAHLPSILEGRDPQIGDPERQVMVFNEHGSLPPLFFMHGSVESAACCAELASRCGSEQPVFVLPACGASGEPVPATIEDIAARQVDALRSRRQHGPYALAGFCRSAPVAFETARQLRSAGENVRVLVLIESRIENTHRLAGALRRLVDATGRIRGASHAARAHQYVVVRQTIERGLRVRFNGAPAGAETRVDRIGAAYLAARAAYVPRRYDGRVVFLNSTEGGGFDTRWNKIAPDLDLVNIAGDHTTCLTTHRQALCADLMRALAEPPRGQTPTIHTANTPACAGHTS